MLYGHAIDALLAPAYKAGAWIRRLAVPARADVQPVPAAVGLRVQRRHRPALDVAHHADPEWWKRVRRFALFVVLGYMLHFPAGRVFDLPWAREPQWRSFYAVDVLQLIGVTFIGVQCLVLLVPSRRRVRVRGAGAGRGDGGADAAGVGHRLEPVAADGDLGVPGAGVRPGVSALPPVPVVGVHPARRRARPAVRAVGRRAPGRLHAPRPDRARRDHRGGRLRRGALSAPRSSPAGRGACCRSTWPSAPAPACSSLAPSRWRPGS